MRSELKHKRVSLAIYCLAMLGFLAMYVSVYPSIQEQAQRIKQLVDAYPKEFLQAFGLKSIAFDSLAKYLGLEQFSFTWPIIAIILTLSRAGSAIAGEIERGTMGLLLALPISRLKIFAAKYLAGLTAVVLFIIFSVVAIMPMAALANISYNAADIWRTALLSLLFMWSLLSFGLFISAAVSERGRVYIISSGVLMLMYVLNVFAGIQDKLDKFKYASVFHYFNGVDVISGHSIMTSSYLVFGISIVVFTALGALAFTKRDVSV